ncbi:MAG: type II toxin-antitoxin system HicA family toxin [Rickettsiales bacterium]|jgi:predicted RNA binding protein YcfA (HicA-like mRNA interferase family)|nr:type II toxin-antitoxin system HicA family toxin [Rickettsiales bacterium]
MKSYSSKEMISLITADGWVEVSVRGSHHNFKHTTKLGRVTVPHPKKDLDSVTAKSILKQAGLK